MERYRRARRAKLALAGPGSWEDEFKVLLDDDARPLVELEPESLEKRSKKRKRNYPEPTEGRRKTSWIWRGADADGDAGETDSLRVEWLKSRARAMRWYEERQLLPEEMRRCLASLLHDETTWTNRSNVRVVANPHLREGLIAYAHEQASIRRAMRSSLRTTCLLTLVREGAVLGQEWGVVDASSITPAELSQEDEEYDDMARMCAVDEEQTIAVM